MAGSRLPARPGDPLAWLAGLPSLDDLRAAYPEEWPAVQAQLAAVATGGGPALRTLVAELGSPARPTPGHRRARAIVVREEVRRQMLLEAVRRAALAAETGVQSGRVRFNLVNGWVAQKLLFRRDLERRPVSITAFRLVWPLLWQRRLLMPLVRPKGIYCFYSGALVTRLAALIGGRETVEIAAGDGTLTRFLAARGVSIVATDDYSWHGSITYPADVVRQGAATAVHSRQPEVVVCSWPPPENTFEREVFRCPSVQTYIVIGSAHESGSGSWSDYRRQTTFALTEAPHLARLVLPPQQGNRVLVFERLAPDGRPDSTVRSPGSTPAGS